MTSLLDMSDSILPLHIICRPCHINSLPKCIHKCACFPKTSLLLLLCLPLPILFSHQLPLLNRQCIFIPAATPQVTMYLPPYFSSYIYIIFINATQIYTNNNDIIIYIFFSASGFSSWKVPPEILLGLLAELQSILFNGCTIFPGVNTHYLPSHFPVDRRFCVSSFLHSRQYYNKHPNTYYFMYWYF